MEETQQKLKAELKRDRVTGRCWLAFARKPEPEACAGLAEGGWRFSRTRGEWYHPARYAKVPDGIEATDVGLCDYNAERADMLEERAQKQAEKSAQHLESAHARGAHIPFGQPILVGHHSEGRARADVAAIDRHMQAGMEAHHAASALTSRAEGSRERQAHHDNPRVARRRLERLEKELARPGLHPDVAADIHRQVADTRESAAQPIASDTLNPMPGDIAQVGSWLCLLWKVNEKTLECLLLQAGVWGSDLKLPRLELRLIFSRGNPLPYHVATCMVPGADGKLGVESCPHQHDSRRKAATCCEKTWPKSSRVARASRLVVPEGLKEAVASLRKAG